MVREWLLWRARDITQETARRSALVLAPHPDDEVLGCAATIMRKLDAGSSVAVAFVSDGGSSTEPIGLSARQRADLRRGEAVAAARAMGLDEEDLTFLGLVDGALEDLGDELIERIGDLLAAHDPEELFVPVVWDDHPDHRAVSLAVRRLLADGRLSGSVLEYPVWLWKVVPRTRNGTAGGRIPAGSDPFSLARTPVEKVATAGMLERKRRALSAYASRTNLHPRFLEHFFSRGELFFPVPGGAARPSTAGRTQAQRTADRATPRPSHERSDAVRRLAEIVRTSPSLDAGHARLQGLATFALGPRYPLRRAEQVRPFFLVGSGRSGNTLLRRVLMSSPEVHIPPETYALQSVISLFRRQRLAWPHLVRLVLAQFEYHPLFEDFDLSLRPVANRLFDVPEHDRSLACILDAFYRHHGEYSGQVFERWGDKTPLNCYALERIAQVFPDAQIVHVLRDGADVVHSYIASGLMDDVDSAALRWVTSVAAARRFATRHSSACLEVRYEQLASDPAPVVSEICSFLGIRFDPAMLSARDHVATMHDLQRHAYYAGVAEPITPQSVGKGRSALTPAERGRVQAIAGRVLAAVGYEPLD